MRFVRLLPCVLAFACGCTGDPPPAVVRPPPTEADAAAPPPPICADVEILASPAKPWKMARAGDGVAVLLARTSAGPAAILRVGADGAESLLFTAEPSAEISVLAADDSNVYFTYLTPSPVLFTIRALPIAGGPARDLVQNHFSNVLVAFHGTLFFTDGNQQNAISSVPVSGGTPQPVATLPKAIAAMAIDDTGIYALDETRVWKIDPTNGTTTALGTHTPAYDIAIDDAFVYFKDGDAANVIHRVPKAGGADQHVVLPGGFGGLDVDDTFIYLAREPDLCPRIGECGEGAIVRLKKTLDAPVEVLATGQAHPEQVLAIGKRTYWISTQIPCAVPNTISEPPRIARTKS